MALLELYAVCVAMVLVYMTAVWVLSVRVQDASIVDVAWGSGFVLVAVAAALLSDGFGGRRVLVPALTTAWGLRLSLHIFWRNRGRGEDFRYQAWRRRAGPSFWWRSFFQVFMVQGALLSVIAAPLVVAVSADTPDRFTILDLAGAAVWATGFFFEAVGDLQLARFKGDPANAGKVMRSGLWSLTRHPNYFGDATCWWGYFLLAAATPFGYLTAFGPALMTFLLVRVSGVALLERTQVKAKPGYREYVAEVSAFIPWFPRKGA